MEQEVRDAGDAGVTQLLRRPRTDPLDGIDWHRRQIREWAAGTGTSGHDALEGTSPGGLGSAAGRPETGSVAVGAEADGVCEQPAPVLLDIEDDPLALA